MSDVIFNSVQSRESGAAAQSFQNKYPLHFKGSGQWAFIGGCLAITIRVVLQIEMAFLFYSTSQSSQRCMAELLQKHNIVQLYRKKYVSVCGRVFNKKYDLHFNILYKFCTSASSFQFDFWFIDQINDNLHSDYNVTFPLQAFHCAESLEKFVNLPMLDVMGLYRPGRYSHLAVMCSAVIHANYSESLTQQEEGFLF